MALKSEVRHTAEFIHSEANGQRSRDNIILITGENLPAGRALGIITASGKFTELAPGAATGEEVAAGFLITATDATAADVVTNAIVRDAEINPGEATFPAGISGPELVTATTELKARGIVSAATDRLFS